MTYFYPKGCPDCGGLRVHSPDCPNKEVEHGIEEDLEEARKEQMWPEYFPDGD